MSEVLVSLKKFAQKGNLLKAFELLSCVRRNVSVVDSTYLILHSVSAVLLCCTNAKSIKGGKSVHGFAIYSGLEKYLGVMRRLVDLYASVGLVGDARVVVETSSVRKVSTWNWLISCYVRNGYFVDALLAYKMMVSRGIAANKWSYLHALKACGEILNVGFGQGVHGVIMKCGDGSDLLLQNELLVMYGKFGDVGVAQQLFSQMSVKDSASYSTVILISASKGMWDEAMKLFDKTLKENIDVNNITWNTISGECLRRGQFHLALKLIADMVARGALLDSVAIIIGLGACSHIGAIRLGKQIHGYAICSSRDKYIQAKNTLITMYSRCQDFSYAYKVFQFMEEKSIVTWTSMISGYAHMDRYEEAFILFREMILSGMEPDYVTIASTLPLCARVANLQYGKEFHCYIIKHQMFKENLLLWNALVDMYARSGKIAEAERLFNSMCERNLVTYNALIAGYGMQGNGQAALKLFTDMIKQPIKPDHVTMVAVLSACSHSGLLVQGQMWFKQMAEIYGIKPHIEHYACMVVLYGRAGLLNEAKDTIAAMPYEPTPAIWATLLGSCHIHGNTEIEKLAAEKLLEMKHENPGYYVLIANVFAAAGCKEKLAEVRTLIRDLRLKKAPGCSWVNDGPGFRSFSMEDTSIDKQPETYLLLEGLTEHMKDVHIKDIFNS